MHEVKISYALNLGKETGGMFVSREHKFQVAGAIEQIKVVAKIEWRKLGKIAGALELFVDLPTLFFLDDQLVWQKVDWQP